MSNASSRIITENNNLFQHLDLYVNRDISYHFLNTYYVPATIPGVSISFWITVSIILKIVITIAQHHTAIHSWSWDLNPYLSASNSYVLHYAPLTAVNNQLNQALKLGIEVDTSFIHNCLYISSEWLKLWK